MSTSEFIDKKSDTKSVTSVVVINNKKRFKKQLNHTNKDSLRHKAAMYKEFEIGHDIHCPYIVKYISISEDENGLYILMEHINGMNIAEKMAMEPEFFSNHRNTEKMLRQLLKALKVLHEHNIAYLDLKPENVMLTQISNDVRLVDLGGCFTDHNDYTAERTRPFASPELSNNDLEKVDARTDIYGIGKLLQYIEEESGTPLPKHLNLIKERCLNEDKKKRFENTDEIEKVLKRRNRTIASLTTFFALLVFAGIGWQLFIGTKYHKLLMLNLNTDTKIEGIHYKIVSKTDKACVVMGQTDSANLYIYEHLNIDGQKYTTIEIADSAFCDCTKVASVFLPQSLRRIGEYAFYNCKNMASATIPEGITTIERKCFKGSGVTYLKLPNTLETIGHAAFARCKRLKQVVVPEGTETLGLDAFANCDSLVSIQLPSTLKTISRGVFWMCFDLQEITIPAGVTTIGEYAFFECHKLQHIYNYAPEPQNLSAIIRLGQAPYVTVHVPAASVEKYRNAHHWKDMIIVGDL
jgi:tRNA A-37 threonylcarbamoyl transferase component Bud32